MRYLSSRNNKVFYSLSEAIHQGMASDGGLFIPEELPQFDWADFSENRSYPDFAAEVLKPFFALDRLENDLEAICKKAFSFPLVLKQLSLNDYALELFHGPTASFKDFGAGFLAGCLTAHANKDTTILVATSGDTGSAVASAFYQKKHYKVIILYPEGQISARQEQQMTCWDSNITALAVAGSFDDCQRLVKEAFSSQKWNAKGQLSSANSINIGRLLPQMTYYAYSSLQFYQKHKKKPGYIIPSGNLGHATAAFWAKKMGFPIREIVLATNANKVLEDYLSCGLYKPQKSIATLANAMDVGNPSNIERLDVLFGSFKELQKAVFAYSVSDAEIKKTILEIDKRYQYSICPHTATAFFVRKQLAEKPWIIAATASPSKFDDILEPIIGRLIPLAPQLKTLLQQPQKRIKVPADLEIIMSK